MQRGRALQWAGEAAASPATARTTRGTSASSDRPGVIRSCSPEVCWQLPLRRIDSTDDNGHVTSTLREWKRRDWSEGGFEFAWWCTDEPEAFVGDHTVLVSMADELIAMVGKTIYKLLVTAVAERAGPALTHPAIQVPEPKRRQRAS